AGSALFAQNQNALVIGIDTYLPPKDAKVSGNRSGFTNLDGCKNDAMSMKSLIQNKYRFFF
ncbi:hypothetical protein ABFV57_34610, partial [Pseudomonas neuropathica]|uniref:hypothetical protein n=1 Tax=Pseudomonas neuropathica TaxID=2730425 RepID=UPI0034D463A2